MRAEEELRRSEQRYRDLLEQAADGIFLLDENGNFLIANSEICRILGYTRKELLQLNILDTYPEELRDVGKGRLDEIKSGERMRFERTMKRKDGSVCPVEMSARRLADGKMQGIAHDITERKRTESELALERSLLNALMENIPDYIYFKDAESRFIRTSRAHARMFGLRDAHEVIGKTDADFFSEEHALRAYEDEQRIVRTGEPLVNKEEKETWPDRPDTRVLTTKMLLRGPQGTILGTFGISRDITERTRMEEALRESEERYRQLVELCPDAILVHREGKIVFVNSSALALFGAADPGALLRRDVMDLVHPDFREIVQERSRRIQKEGEFAPREEQKCLRFDGTAFDIEVSSAPIFYEGARASLTIIRDITDRKRSEETLRRRVEEMGAFQSTLLELTTPHEQSQLLEIIVERAVYLLHADGGGLYLCDSKQQVARCVVSYNTPSDYAGTILKYGEGAAGVVAQTGKPLVIDDYRTWSRRAVSFESDKPFRTVASVPLLWQGQVTGVIQVLRYQERNPFSQADLELLSLFANHAAIAAENARLLDGLQKELSERKQLEAEREEATQRLEFVVGATQTGFDIIDANYDMQYIDPARMKMFGDYRGRKCYEYFRGRSSPCGNCAMIRALATHTVEVTESTNPAVATRPTQVTAIPYQTESGEWMVAEVSVDISERKKAEAERLELERRMLSAQKLEGLGILAGGVAHNFNNLLAVMLGYAQLLRDKTSAEVEFKAAVDEIIKAGFRSRDLIGQLLAMGRRQTFDLVPLDLNQVITESRTFLRQAIRDNVTIEFRLASTPCPVMADAGRIEQILLNFALNAQDAILRDGSLIYETSETVLDGARARRHEDMAPGRYILLTVSDTGAGMDRETMDRIFDPFFTTKKEGKGTGLGLSTVYGIVKQHGGNIEVESEPGHGTRFKIYLTRTDVPLQRSRDASPTQDREGTETLLLVEDQDSVRVLLGRQLRSLGYTVLEAASGTDALRIAAEHKSDVHLLLTDVILEGMNGLELYNLLTRERAGIRVLYASGYTKGVLTNHGVAEEGVDFIQKPFDMHALAAKVREVLDRD